MLILFYVLLVVLLASSVQGLRIPSKLAAIGVGLSVMLPSCAAVATQEIGNIPTTGFVFKDYLRVNEIPDPKIKGISVYIADFDRPGKILLTHSPNHLLTYSLTHSLSDR